MEELRVARNHSRRRVDQHSNCAAIGRRVRAVRAAADERWIITVVAHAAGAVGRRSNRANSSSAL
eukprot:7386140-Prymnesium_polylepis.1